MFWSTCLTAGVLAAGALAAPTGSVLHEKRDVPASEFRQRVDPDAIIPIRIALSQSNLHTGYDRLMEVSHPSSNNYGKHLSAEEVHELFAPSQESIDAVKSWLLGSGLVLDDDVVHYENKGWLSVDMPAKHAESLLSTEYYEHELSDGTRLGCDEYYLPAHVSPLVDFIKPGIKLSSPMKKRTVEKRVTSLPGHGPTWHHPPHVPHPYPHWTPPPYAGQLPPDLRTCGVNITPVCLQALYHIPRGHLDDPEDVMGLFESPFVIWSILL